MAALLALAACGGPDQRNPPLPAGLDTLLVAPVDANAFVYARPADGVRLEPEALSRGAAGGAIRVESIEAVGLDLGSDYAVRLSFFDDEAAGTAGALAERAIDTEDGEWAGVDGREVTLGRGRGDWTEGVRSAWQGGELAPFADRYADVWELLRRMPDEPPERPFAAGFVRNVADLIDRLLATKGVPLPGLTDGLGLLRAGPAAFVAYSGDLGPLPGGAAGSILRDANAGVIFVAEAGYPGFVVDFTFARLASGQLVEVEVGGQTVSYREVNPDLHLMIKAFGRALFFIAAPTRERAEELAAAVIRGESESREAASNAPQRPRRGLAQLLTPLVNFP